MQPRHAFNVIAMLQMLARQGPCRCSPIFRPVLLAGTSTTNKPQE
jgi:hypothetical protein